MLASVELKKRENRDDLDFLQMNGYVPCSIYSIYLLTGYEGIASLLSLRHWLLTEAKPRSIVRVEGTTNLLFPNTVYKYFIMPKNIRLIVEWSPQNDKDQ